MAKKQGVNKTRAVHDYWKAHPRETSSQIAEALTKQGINISSQYVANIKSKSKKKGRAVRAVGAKRGVGIPEIKAALSLIKVCGSTAAAKEALAAADEIRAML